MELVATFRIERPGHPTLSYCNLRHKVALFALHRRPPATVVAGRRRCWPLSALAAVGAGRTHASTPGPLAIASAGSRRHGTLRSRPPCWPCMPLPVSRGPLSLVDTCAFQSYIRMLRSLDAIAPARRSREPSCPLRGPAWRSGSPAHRHF